MPSALQCIISFVLSSPLLYESDSILPMCIYIGLREVKSLKNTPLSAGMWTQPVLTVQARYHCLPSISHCTTHIFMYKHDLHSQEKGGEGTEIMPTHCTWLVWGHLFCHLPWPISLLRGRPRGHKLHQWPQPQLTDGREGIWFVGSSPLPSWQSHAWTSGPFHHISRILELGN